VYPASVYVSLSKLSLFTFWPARQPEENHTVGQKDDSATCGMKFAQ
jgi:hypothetical protein